MAEYTVGDLVFHNGIYGVVIGGTGGVGGKRAGTKVYFPEYDGTKWEEPTLLNKQLEKIENPTEEETIIYKELIRKYKEKYYY